MSNFSSPGISIKETDISQVTTSLASSVGAIVGVSNKGPVNDPTLITNAKQFTEIFGIPDAQIGYMHYCALDFLSESNRLYVTRVTNNAYMGGIVINNTTAGSSTTALSGGVTDRDNFSFSSYADGAFVVIGRNPGTWNNDLKVSIENLDSSEYTFDIVIWDTSSGITTEVERTTVSRKTKKDGFGRQLYLEDKINTVGGSAYIWVVDNILIDESTMPKAVATSVAMTQGTNGNAVSDTMISTGWDLFADKDSIQVNLLINAGYATNVVQSKMITISESREDCFAILDLPSDSQTVAGATTYRTGTLGSTSSYAGLYGPYINVADEYNDKILYIPPSGIVGAVFAYTDEVSDPWFAPAGPRRSRPLEKILGLEKAYSRADRDTLYESGINPIIKAGNLGYSIHGQKTLQGNLSATQSINVRRLLITIQTAMSTGLDVFLFQPNDELTRNRIADMLNSYMRQVKARRGVYDFQVVCDTSNNVPQIIDEKKLLVDVYLKPTRAAEFIVLQTVITKTGADFNELITTGGNI